MHEDESQKKERYGFPLYPENPYLLTPSKMRFSPLLISVTQEECVVV